MKVTTKCNKQSMNIELKLRILDLEQYITAKPIHSNGPFRKPFYLKASATKKHIHKPANVSFSNARHQFFSSRCFKLLGAEKANVYQSRNMIQKYLWVFKTGAPVKFMGISCAKGLTHECQT